MYYLRLLMTEVAWTKDELKEALDGEPFSHKHTQACAHTLPSYLSAPHLNAEPVFELLPELQSFLRSESLTGGRGADVLYCSVYYVFSMEPRQMSCVSLEAQFTFCLGTVQCNLFSFITSNKLVPISPTLVPMC